MTPAERRAKVVEDARRLADAVFIKEDEDTILALIDELHWSEQETARARAAYEALREGKP